MHKSLRNNSCSIFLAVRGLSDNGFLTTLLIIWISRAFRLQLGSTHGACRIIIFLTYVCGFISVWMVVFVTAENYIRICRPFVVNRLCTPTKAKIIVSVLGLIAVCLYNFPFWAMTPSTCLVYSGLVSGLVYTDTALTLAIPFVCLFLLMTAIVCDLVKSYKRRRHLRAPNARKNRNPMATVTKMLFAVTLSFFILNLPSHVNRLRLMILPLIGIQSRNEFSSLDQAVEQITLSIYYLSLAFNIVLYFAFGSRFRCVFIDVFFSRCKDKMLCLTSNNNDKQLAEQSTSVVLKQQGFEVVPMQEYKDQCDVRNEC
ncbi:FMRFamide receptor-like [Dreissena polymorpha]|uniref:FMRFamide receptor-like n=1 Tax=Dreissena polymorpha TaxID=45954 RepID=UPI0022647182|nr:FMRFamide receptor-like [Dreissena polymorpha]